MIKMYMIKMYMIYMYMLYYLGYILTILYNIILSI